METFPLLRGWLHLVAAVVAVPAGMAMVIHASTPRAAWASAVYAVGVTVMFSTSATYHRGRWSSRVRPWMKRADHGAIFVMIASTYTPLCLVTLADHGGPLLLTGVWIGAIGGVIGAATGYAEKRVIGLVAYIAFGWLALLALPALASRLETDALLLLIAGGVVFTVGAIGLGTRRPDLFPQVFGYHEVWHLLVVVGVAFHYAVVWSAVS